MHEIRVPSARPRRNSIQKRMLVGDVERIPTHVRNLERRSCRFDRATLALDPAKPRRLDEFEPTFTQELHSNTNAKERPALTANSFVQRFNQPGNAFEPGLAIAIGTDTRQ